MSESTYVEYEDGAKCWYNKQKRYHKEDGPAVTWDGSKWWYKDGELHREDGPAVEWLNGKIEYWLNGYCHRDDGPAVKRVDGQIEYWLNGVHLSELEYFLKTGDINQL